MRIYPCLTLVVVLLLVSVAPRASAQGIPRYMTDGNSLYVICTAHSGDTITDTASEGMCLGYVTGVATTLDLLDFITLGSGVTQGQLQDVVVKYLRENPATRNHGATSLTIGALVAAFPKRN